MPDSDRELLRTAFTAVSPELYDRARPGYPAELFDDLARLAGVGPGCRVLEVGCGTGQATVPLAERGCRIVAVELSAGMARLARAKLARFRSVEVMTAAFEDFALPAQPFDLVLSATAFHWIDPEVRVRKSADALRPGGKLATIATQPAAGGTEAFFRDVRGCFDRFMPTRRTRPEPTVDAGELERSGRFEPAEFHRYEAEIEYTTEQYLEVLSTYSEHLLLEPGAREGLLRCIGRVMDERYGGNVRKRYRWEMRIARRF